METTLHQQLKAHYAGDDGATEVRLGRWRIDAVCDDLLIEVQHAGLAAIRDKVLRLARSHDILVVKPIVARKWIVRYDKRDGKVVSRRKSPKQGSPLDVFDELVHFTRAFRHRRVQLEVPLIDVEETRIPGHGRRRRWRKNDHQVVDQRMLELTSTTLYRQPRDLLDLLPANMPRPFDTSQLADALEVERWVAQRVAYVLRETAAVRESGKRGNARLYELPRRRQRVA